MTRNDGFYKFLFALELALLPMVIFANIFLPKWSMGLIIAGVFVCKLWREIFKDRKSRYQSVLGAIASIIEFSVILIYFAVEKMLNLPVAVIAVVLVALFNLFKQVLFTKRMPETIDAVDFCYMIFELLALVCLIFISLTSQPATIALWAVILTSAVSVIYKIYYLFRYEDLFGKIKGIFRRR